jgi:hypothetical protein
MATVLPELTNGHEYNDLLGGFEITRVFRVTDLVDAPNRQLIEAVNDSAIPQIGELYPGTTGILVTRRNSRPAGPNAAIVTCVYSAKNNNSSYNQPFPSGNDGQDVKQVRSSTREVKVTKDFTGAPMLLSPPTSKKSWEPYLSEATVLIPVGAVVFERVETSPPTDRARALTGKVNSVSLGGGNYPARTLLFAEYDDVTEDGGRRWNCTYVFRYDPLKWVHTDRYHGPSGKVPDGVSDVSWDVLPEADFSTLGLDFSDSQSPIS